MFAIEYNYSSDVGFSKGRPKQFVIGMTVETNKPVISPVPLLQFNTGEEAYRYLDHLCNVSFNLLDIVEIEQ